MKRPAFTAVGLAAGVLLMGAPVSGVDAASPVASAPATTQQSLLTSITGDPVLGAVGDMACDPADNNYNNGAGTSTACEQSLTSNTVLADTSLDGILGLGDYQYDCGDSGDYAVSYNPTWGRLDLLMNPVAGNHEYKTGTDAFGSPCPTNNTTASNYFARFGAASHPESAGHFSFDVGSWHLIGLNGNCIKSGVGGCTATSSQTVWLKSDLASTTQPCIAAFWHQPLLSGSGTGMDLSYQPWWDALYAARADVVLNGHLHNYQRYTPMSPSGTPDSTNGITEYVVGTGGEAMATVNAGAVPQPVTWRKTFGYLRMTLHPSGWDSEFIDTSGTVLDTSGGTCHAAAPSNSPPVARMSSSCSGLACNVDGSASSDSDGTVASWAWDFGDGATGTGPTASHTYSVAGTYTVSLTVTDNSGATGISTSTVTVAPAATGIGFRGSATANGNVTTASVVVPSQVVAGDGLLLLTTVNNTTQSVTGPAGWQQVREQLAGQMRTVLWQRVATATDAGTPVSVRLSSTGKVDVQLLAYSGTSSAGPVVASAGAANTTATASHTTPLVQAVPSGSWVVSYWADKSSTTRAWTPPAGQTVRPHASYTTGSAYVTSLVTDSGAPVSGTYGGLTATVNAPSSKATMLTVVLGAS